jgi:acyl-CoA synthetase (AMP-forming)/AMP-acid ligase II
MRDCSTLVEVLRTRAQHTPERCAYTFLADGENETGGLTYGEVDARARVIAGWLQSQGLTGERALLLYPPGLEYVSAFWGCLYAGVVAVPAYPPHRNRPMPRLSAIAADSAAAVVLTTTAIRADVDQRVQQAPDLQALSWQATDTLDRDLMSAWRDPELCEDALAFLQYTSGSTALPKGVRVSHGNLIANQRMQEHALNSPEELVLISWLPPFHDMGLISGILHSIYVGGRSILMPPLMFLKKPLLWLNLISRHQGWITSGAPNFAYDLCVDKTTPEQRALLDLSHWRVAYCAAEPVRKETVDRFTKTFAQCGFRDDTFLPGYGLAEATLIVSGGPQPKPPVFRTVAKAALEEHSVLAASSADEGVQTFVGCGQTVLDQELVIAHPETCVECPPGRIGEIWVKGPHVTQGYWNRSEETSQTFGASLAHSGRGPFLRTGDLGFLNDGELFITGRLKDLIIIAGRNIYPQDIEFTAEKSHPAFQPGASAAFAVTASGPEQLGVALEVKREHYRKLDPEKVIAAVRQAVAAEHQVRVEHVILVRPAGIPKTSSGKIQRRLCRSKWQAGELDSLQNHPVG